MSSLRSVLLHSALALVPLFTTSGCSSTGGSSADGGKVRVTLRDYKGGRSFELVGQSHTNRLEYYSKVRDSAGRKIVPDDIARALVGELEKRGFKKNRKPGRAPSQGGQLLTWGFEVADTSGVDHWVIGRGSDPAETQAFLASHQVFFELYNTVTSYQTVENEKGRSFFDGNPAPPAQAPTRP